VTVPSAGATTVCCIFIASSTTTGAPSWTSSPGLTSTRTTVPGIGATSEPWPLAAQLVRRASFDLLAGYTERSQLEPSHTAITDKLTTLYTRPMFDAVLAKELERAARFNVPLSLILFDVDRLSSINKQHGYGVGDKVLERLGILMRQYFRQHDWVARYAEDAIAVLLTRTEGEHASELAERVRATVEERLGFTDHLSERAVPVTVSPVPPPATGTVPRNV